MAFMDITFPGGLRVDASLRGMTISSDQPVFAGGEGSAPAPFDMFLASIGTCAGIYALQFCNSKGISTEGLKLEMDVVKNRETGLLGQISLHLTLPEGFPEKYKAAIIRSMDLCAVKKHMFTPPEFVMTAE